MKPTIEINEANFEVEVLNATQLSEPEGEAVEKNLSSKNTER